MNFSFLEWEKTKSETTLLYLWIRVIFSWGLDFSRNTEPESFLIGFILETVTIENRDLRLGTRIYLLLYGKNFNDFVQLVMKLKHFVRGSFPGWGKHLTCICNRCQSVVSRLKLGRAYCLNGNEEATRGFTFKVDKVQIRCHHFVIEMNCRPMGSVTEVKIRCKAWDLETSFSRVRCYFLC